MPQAIAAFIVSAIGITGTAATIATAVIATAITVGISIGVAKLLAPGIPDPEAVQTPLKQSFAARQSAFGEVRISGPYALFDAVAATSIDVIAAHDGRINAVTRHYLNDDRVTLTDGYIVNSPDGDKYANGRVRMYTTLGQATETAFAEVSAVLPAWDANHRGDGIASIGLVCSQVKLADMLKVFPNNVPEPSIAIEAQLVYDPRDEAQVQGDKNTYVYSDNPALCLLAYLTDANGGMGLDYATRIYPAIDLWIAAADDCDADEVTSEGTEKRYRCGGVYRHDNSPGDVIANLLACFDGWMGQRGDGALAVHSGRYYAPTVTFEDKHVLSYELQHFLTDEEAVNEYIPNYTDPDSEFTTVDTDAVRDEADITARGVVRSSPLNLPWVPSPSQAVRVARRKLDRAVQPVRGTVTVNLHGMHGLGERYIELDIADNAVLSGIAVEITGPPQVDLTSLTLTFPFTAVDATIDDGDPGSGVTPPGPPPAGPDPDPLEAPEITSLTAVYDDSAAGIAGARIQASVTAPEIAEADVQWKLRWRKSGDTNWTEGQYDDIADGAAVTLLTGFVTATGTIEVQVAYITAARTSPWSDTETIALATPSIIAKTMTASEDITAPALVNIHNASGAKIRKADATAAGKEANGFITSSVTSGAATTVLFEGTMTGLSSLTPGARYYTATTPGGVTATAPSGSGNVVQPIGVAVSSTEIDFEAGQAVELA